MEATIKTIHKLFDKLLLPQYDDIIEYQITFNQGKIEITFWMDGTDQEIEEEIVDECWGILDMIRPTSYRFRYKFTTDGKNFYEYS
jgi:hypothetical protein